MPESQQPIEGQRIMRDRILSNPGRVIDIGAGDGKWGKLLRGKVSSVTALEAWLDAVTQNHLDQFYDHVIVMRAQDFSTWENYDIAIFGDVLEHIPRGESVPIVNELRDLGLHLYLTVPITKCVQDGKVYGNPFETHRDQWSHEELEDLGWKRLHAGPNPNGLVTIGTYELKHG